MSCRDREDNGNKRRSSDQIDSHSRSGNEWPTMMRTSSSSSVNAVSSASSAHNSDDEDSETTSTTSSLKERRREAHTQAEQFRRDAIKKGYEELQAVNPITCNASSAGKLSKASILQKSLDYIQYSQQQSIKNKEAIEALNKDVTALHIIKKSYEQMVRNCHSNNRELGGQLSNDDKFYVMKHFFESLFSTFDPSVDISSFEQLSSCVFAWLEDHCKPTMLKELSSEILNVVDKGKNSTQPS